MQLPINTEVLLSRPLLDDCTIQDVGGETLAALFAEHARLFTAAHRLARMTAGATLPDLDGRPLVLSALEAGVAAVRDAHNKDVGAYESFVRGVTSKLNSVMRQSVYTKTVSSWALWNPLDDYLIDELRRHKSKAMLVLPNHHPLSGSSQASIIIASRVFALSDLVRANVANEARAAA